MSKKQRAKQAGIVSLMVTFVMMIVISLIVLGFSESTRRNSREALDRQLSTQAYYAAESGINDAITAYGSGLLATPAKVVTASNTNTCKGSGSFISDRGLTPELNTTDNVSYTCLLVKDELPDIRDSVELGQSSVQNLHMTGLGSSQLTISWTSDGLNAPTTNCPTTANANNLPDASAFTANCKYALLRVDVVPATTVPDADALATATQTFYLMPTKDRTLLDAQVSYAGDTGRIVPAYCSGGSCQVRLIGLVGTDFYTRMSTIYNTAPNVQIGALAPGVVFKGSQLQIDATGQAQDQLRRIQVRVRLNNDGTVPVNAVSSTAGLCKRFLVLGPSSSATPDYNDPSTPLCRND